MKQIHSRHPLILAFGVALSAGLACSGTRGRANEPAPSGALPTAAGAPLSRAANAWVDRTLAGLTLRDQVAQMVMVWVLGDYASTTDADFANARRLVAEERIGGIVMSLGSPIEVAAKVNELQRSARIPLLISSDLEPGLGRLEGGTFAPTQYTGGSATILPNAMAIGATGDATLAEAAGRVTGAEARAVGIHLVFAPVVDVNNNPANPVINTRSFGEDAAEVSRLSVAFVRGMQSAGIAATAKHFPGHGDTETDSHLALPVVRSDRARLDAVELAPFRATINAGIAGVMSAHVALPAIARDSIPATLAPAIMTGLLRDTLGFRGLTLTDALTMQGIGQGYDVEQSAVLSVKAGSDIMLMPSDVPRAIGAVVRAVEQGVIPRAAISAAVRRQLVLKVQTGAVARPVVPLDSLRMIVGSAEHRGIAAEIGKRAVTLLRDRDALIPLRPGQLTLAITYGVESDLLAGREFTTALRAGIGAIRTARVSPSTQRSQLDSLLRPNERLVVYTMVRTYEGEGRSALAPAFAKWLDSVAATRPTAVVAGGNPYILREVPRTGTYLATFGRGPALEVAAARALAGEATTGRSPVTLPGFFTRGDGIRRTPAGDDAAPIPDGSAAASRRATILDTVRAVLDAGVRDSAFPGAFAIIGRRSGVLAQYGAGRLDSRESARPDARTLWDMASLTKVVSLTSAMMQLVEDGRVSLDAPVQRYLPGWTGPNKERVTVRHLLTHSSGLPAWRPVYKEATDTTSAMQLVYSTPLDTLPGVRMVYSDLGAILLGEVVRAVTGQRIDAWVGARVFGPLGMMDTRYLPERRDSLRTAPTEIDPWRQRHLRGEVHDENAFALGGVSAHAGLFSTGHDMARFAQAYLNGGELDGKRVFKPETIREFTTVQDSTFSNRALGWETPTGTNSAGRLLTRPAFGHTGFTGTSMWIDPARDVFVVLLTNRVNPTRANTRIGRVRQQLADAVVSALGSGRD